MLLMVAAAHQFGHLGVVWVWSGSGLGVVWDVVWRWSGRGLGVVWVWSGMWSGGGLGVFLINLSQRS
jgi:hypothetical protein